MGNTLHGAPTKVSAMRPARNPNSSRSVFDPPNKRRKTQETLPPINLGPSGPPKRSSVTGRIDLTNNDAESSSRSPTVADISDDSLNIGTEKRPSSRVANDGRATQRLKGSHRGGISSKAVDTDSETEPIEYYPEPERKPMIPKEKKGKVQDLVRNFESRDDGESYTPKLNFKPRPPLLSTKPKLKVRLFFIEEGGQLADPCSQDGAKQQKFHPAHELYLWDEGQGESCVCLGPDRLGTRHGTPHGITRVFSGFRS